MARIRTIKPTAFTSESLANVSIAADWTFAGLWTYADDEGRGRADPRLIKGAIFPLRDEVTPSVVDGYLDELEREDCICRYSVGGRSYFHVVHWDHQSISKPTASKIPPCPKGHGDAPVAEVGSIDRSTESVLFDVKTPGQNGGSAHSRESSGDPGNPGESHAGTGNREQGSGTGNREQGTRGARESPTDPMARFPEFWKIYPRSEDRPAAERKWRSVLKAGVDPQLIIDGALRYRDDPNRTAKFTKHGATWLNNSSWENGPLPAERAGSARLRIADGNDQHWRDNGGFGMPGKEAS